MSEFIKAIDTTRFLVAQKKSFKLFWPNRMVCHQRHIHTQILCRKKSKCVNFSVAMGERRLIALATIFGQIWARSYTHIRYTKCIDNQQQQQIMGQSMQNWNTLKLKLNVRFWYRIVLNNSTDLNYLNLHRRWWPTGKGVLLRVRSGQNEQHTHTVPWKCQA